MKMINEPKALREIHDIRLKLYEELVESNITDEEWVKRVNEKSKAIAKRYGLKVLHSVNGME